MIGVDVRASDLLHRAGFSVADWRAVGEGGAVHVVTASGALGSIRAEGPTRAEAFTLALAEARGLLDLGDLPRG